MHKWCVNMDIYRLKITFHIKVVLFLCQHKKSDFAEPAIHKYQLVIINKRRRMITSVIHKTAYVSKHIRVLLVFNYKIS